MRYLSSPRPDVIRLFAIGILFFSFLPAAVRSQEANVKSLLKAGSRSIRNNDLAAAETSLREALRLEPDNAEVKLELALALAKRRALTESYEIAFEVAKADHNNSRAFAILGTTLLFAGRFDEADLALNNALVLNRREALAWAYRGMLEYYENRINDSLSSLQTSLNLRPDEPDYLFAYAQVAARAERFKEAADSYEHFLLVSNYKDTDRRDRIRGLIRYLRFLENRGSLYRIDLDGVSTVPVEMVDNRPIINVKINGSKTPLRFVLDTGSGISVISRATANKLGIGEVTRGGFARALGGNGKFEIVYGFIRSLEIGSAKVNNIPIYIREFHPNGKEVDGYIGLAMISKFLTTIDYGDRTFSIVSRDGRVGNDAKPDLSLPLRLTSGGFLSGEVKMSGVEDGLNFIVDTGASISVISDKVANTGKVKDFADLDTLNVIGAAGVTLGVPTFTLPELSFGGHSRSSVKAIALNLDVINETSGFEQAGILGGNFLKNYRLTFDFKNSLVTFTAVKPERTEPE